jgi:hypothetical protein
VGQGHALPTVILLHSRNLRRDQEFISNLKTTPRRARQGMAQGMALPHQLSILGSGKTK